VGNLRMSGVWTSVQPRWDVLTLFELLGLNGMRSSSENGRRLVRRRRCRPR